MLYLWNGTLHNTRLTCLIKRRGVSWREIKYRTVPPTNLFTPLEEGWKWKGGGVEMWGIPDERGPGGTVPPGVGPLCSESATYLCRYTPSPLMRPRKWGKEGGGGVRVSAVGTSSPQQLLEAFRALLSDCLRRILHETIDSSWQVPYSCVTHRLTCNFTCHLSG